MRKVIVKCHLKDRDEFEQKLSEIDMDFGPVYWQHDRVYVPRNYQKGNSYPRLLLRTEMKAVDRPARYELILRRHIEDANVDIVDSTVVKDYSEAANIIQQLGFKQQAEVSRRRQEIIMGEGVVLFLDKIDQKEGFYAKLEANLDENDKAEDVQHDLENTMKVLGLDVKNLITDSYAELI